MNKNLFNLTKTICLGMAAFFLWGCGKAPEPASSGTQPTEAQTENGGGVLPEGYAWSTRFEDAGGEIQMHSHIPSTYLIGNSLYYYYREYDRKQGVVAGNAYIQEEGQEPRLLNLPPQDEMLLHAIVAGEDGSLYMLYEERVEDGQFPAYTLEKLDKELQTVYAVDATAGLKEAAESLENPSGVPLIHMAVEADGSLYGLSYTTGLVVCWDEAGSYLGSFTLPKNMTTAMDQGRSCFGLVNAGASGIYAYWGGKESGTTTPSLCLYDLRKWMEMDEAERKSAEPLQVDFSSAPESMTIGTGALFVFSGYEDGLYLTDQNRLWRIDLADGSVEPLLVWEDLTLKGEYVTAVRRQAEGGFLLYIFDTLEQENYWVRLEPVPSDELPEKTELVLGIAGRIWGDESLLSRIDQVVLSYNRTHPYSHVTVKEYGADSITNFQLELLGGKGPDILMELESFFDMETLMSKGAVEDLAPYLASGGEVSDEDILPGILELITKDGRIPRIPLSFSAGIMILPKDRPQEVMTPQEMADFMAGGDDTYIDCLVWPGSFLLQILTGAEMDRYVDAESKSCSFDSEEFVSLLEKLGKLGNMQMVMKQTERFEPLRSGQLMAVVDELDCMGDYLCIRSSFYDSWEIAGFPNSGRKLRYPARLYDWLGISSASQHKEAAWGFIEFCLSYISHSDNASHRFAVMRDKFRRQTQYKDTDDYLVMGNYFFDGNSNDSIPIFEPTTQEETDFLWEISEHLYLYENQNLQQIISEETAAFFAGDISAQEAAERIQNRASLVLSE